MTRQPLGLHAVTHSPSGQDPVQPTSSAVLHITSFNISGGANVFTNIDFNVSTRFQTNDPARYTYGLDTVGNSTHTIRINKPGTYMVSCSAADASWTVGDIKRLDFQTPLNRVGYQNAISQVPYVANTDLTMWFTDMQSCDSTFTFPLGLGWFFENIVGASAGVTNDIALFYQLVATDAWTG